MLRLENSELSVEILSPSGGEDARRQGFRYCRGGYIWQVTDRKAGPLLSGPEGPHPNPDPYNGHGLPESFRPREFGTGRALTLQENEGLILGVGTVRELPEKRYELLEPATWDTQRTETSAVFATAQSYQLWSIRLERTVALEGRTLVSSTALTNRAVTPLDLHWFAHPFLALTEGRIRCRMPKTYGMAENPGYALTADHWLEQKRVFEGVFDGHFEPLVVDPQARFAVTLSHPVLTAVQFETDYAPAICPVWGNGHTWSIEPYLYRQVAPSETFRWSLRYTFGAPRTEEVGR